MTNKTPFKRIQAPFTLEQVEKLNAFQESNTFHPFTCCSPDNIKECFRRNKTGKSYKDNTGILTATLEGWICPCGKYKQDWAHAFMLEEIK